MPPGNFFHSPSSVMDVLLVVFGHICRDREFALPVHVCVGDRPLSLDYLVHHAFTETEAASDVGWSHSHLAKPEDLLFFDFCESENRLKHERRHCAYCTGICAAGWNRRSKQQDGS